MKVPLHVGQPTACHNTPEHNGSRLIYSPDRDLAGHHDRAETKHYGEYNILLHLSVTVI